MSDNLNIESLELDNFDINDISFNMDLLDDDSIKNIIYSYPYYSDDNFDYEYRITFKDNNLILDEIKYNDSNDFQDNIILINNILNKHINYLLPLIKDNIDIRDEKTKLSNDIIHLIDNSNKDYDNLLDENKRAVLKLVYSEILESILE